MAIGATAEYIKLVDKTIIKPAGTPGHLRSDVIPRSLPKIDPAKFAELAPPKSIERKTLPLSPDISQIDDSFPMYQPCDNVKPEELCFHLAIGLKDIRVKARDLWNENQKIKRATESVMGEA